MNVRAALDILLLEVAIEPRWLRDGERLQEALRRLSDKAGSLRASMDTETGQARLLGRDESDLDAAISFLRDCNLELVIGAPQVAYRETPGCRAEADYTHNRHLGPMYQFARVKMALEPLPRGSGFVFENDIVGGSIPKEFIPGVEKGIKSVMNSGPLVGFPVIDFKVTLIDGAYHDVDSSVLAFEIASRAAFREASEKVQMKLLEPVMKVEVVSPEDYVGTVIGDLNSRRGMILGQEMRGNATVINAMVPLANMFGYAKSFHLATQGKAAHRMQFDHYKVVPGDDDPSPFRPAMAMRA